MTVTTPLRLNGPRPSRRVRARRWAGWAREQAVIRGRRARNWLRGWKWTPALPGLAGIGLVSAAMGDRFGVWAGLLAAGVFLLVIDRRLR